MFDAFKRYADFQGRSRRKEFWLFYLLYMIGFVVAYGIMIAGIASSTMAVSYDADGFPVQQAQMSGMTMVGFVLLLLWCLIFFIPLLACQIRRMHDQDKSGWWILVPVANLIFLFIEGTRGPNQYGPDPKGGF